MQEFSVRLFNGAYTLNAKTEQRLLLLAVGIVLFHGCLLGHLITIGEFSTGSFVVYVLHLPVVGFFMLSTWLDSKPQYRRHLTINGQGVRYRSGLMRKEHEFDWEEVDKIHLQLFHISFLLKNEEMHLINLETIQHDETLKKVKNEVKKWADLKQIDLQ